MLLQSLPPSYQLILAALALPSLVGVALAIWGLIPRRIADGPHCRACGYDLSGSLSPRCSECGNDLTRRRATKQGKFQRRWRRAATGIVLAILFAPSALIGGWSALRGDRWEAWLPTSVLLFDLTHGYSWTLGGTVRELTSSYRNGRLSQQQRDEIAFLIASRADADRRHLLNSLTGFDLALDMYIDQMLSPNAMFAFERSLFRVDDVVVQQPASVGEPLPFSIDATFRCKGGGLHCASKITRAIVDGVEIALAPGPFHSNRRGVIDGQIQCPSDEIQLEHEGRFSATLEVTAHFALNSSPRRPLRTQTYWISVDGRVGRPPVAPHKMVQCDLTRGFLEHALRAACCVNDLPVTMRKQPGYDSRLRINLYFPADIPVAIFGDLYVSFDPTSSTAVGASNFNTTRHVGRLDLPASLPIEQELEIVANIPSQRDGARMLIEFIPCDLGGQATFSESGTLADAVRLEGYLFDGCFVQD